MTDDRKKFLSIVGARPQFIKSTVVIKEISKYQELESITVHTGQHYDAEMSEVFFKELNIPEPDYNLNINQLSHGAMTGRMLEKIEKILVKEKPDIVLVYGDTNSTIAGALAAKKLHIKVAHIEAGLRSFNMNMPEEINRILTDRISDLLFCPTKKAVDNLKAEGFGNFDNRIVQSGDVMYDAAMYFSQYAMQPELVKSLDLQKGFVVATIHRESNTDNAENLNSIINALQKIADDIPVIIPLHPRTRKIIKKHKIKIKSPKMRIINPVSYLQMLWLLNNCKIVITDSGGLQKEAFFFKKPCITLRNETEWTELADAGVNVVAGTNKDKILEAFDKMRNFHVPEDLNLYGKGDASEIIVKELMHFKFKE